MPTVITRGAITASGYGFGASTTTPVYVEDVFSTYLYTGASAPQTITNSINLSTNGGMVWMKSRSAATDHAIYDTARGATFDIGSNLTTGQTTQVTGLTAFNNTGFSIGALAKINTNNDTYTSWSFRKQPKFFDIVTYTGTGANRTVSHNLGSVPGCIMIKRTDTTAAWAVYHQSLLNTQYLVLNTTAAAATGATYWNSTTPTSSVFSLGTSTDVNANGGTYVAYIFAHNAGGFGVSGSDNIISCGSFTTSAAGAASVNLGYEPQFILLKNNTTAEAWYILDNMRGIVSAVGTASDAALSPNSTATENNLAILSLTSSGFDIDTSGWLGTSSTYIYMAIRRGPMKKPTSGTSVFSPIASSNVTATKLTTNFPIDMQLFSLRTGAGNKGQLVDRLRRVSTNATETGTQLITSNNLAETTGNIPTLFWDNTGFQMPSSYASASMIFWNFGRAPGFFDVVCYTGTGANTTITHNLGVTPELIIVKNRGATGAWDTYSAALLNTEYLVLNTTAGKATGTTRWNSTSPTSTVFSIGTNGTVNTLNNTYVAYLFATLAGVSKVGSYTGTGTTLQIDCGFSAGARFVIIKRTDTTGDWYVWDTARGIIALNDPYLLINSTAAEVTNTDYIDTYSAGFEISSTAPAAINALNGTYIFLAIA